MKRRFSPLLVEPISQLLVRINPGGVTGKYIMDGGFQIGNRLTHSVLLIGRVSWASPGEHTGMIPIDDELILAFVCLPAEIIRIELSQHTVILVCNVVHTVHELHKLVQLVGALGRLLITSRSWLPLVQAKNYRLVQLEFPAMDNHLGGEAVGDDDGAILHAR